MKIPFVSTTLILCLLAPCALAQDNKAPVDASMPKPTPEHEHLKKAEGTWNVSMEMTGMPASKGTAEMKMTLGGFWLAETFKCDFGGMPFEGHGRVGYDPNKKKYVQTWMDNMSPSVMVMEGTFDNKTMTMTMVGEGYNEMGVKTKMRGVTTHKDANTVVFEMFATGNDGKEAKSFTITYTRKGADIPVRK